jgi:guanylate kinase
MNNNEMKNYAIDLNELWKSGQFLEYAKFISNLYENYSTDIIIDTLKYLKDIQES